MEYSGNGRSDHNKTDSRGSQSSFRQIRKTEVTQYCKSFIKIKAGNGVKQKSNKKIIPFSNSILVRSGNNIVQEYNFDKVIEEKSSHKEVFTDLLLPLIECVFYDHRDATLIAYGHRNTGKTYTLGTYENFFQLQNMLSHSLAFFFKKQGESHIKSQRIHISCFEIFLNCINDLFVKEDDKMDFVDHIKSQPVNDLKEAISLFHDTLSKRKKFYTDKYEESQSHIFINIEVSQTTLNTLGNYENYKGVLTLVDIAGFTEYNNRIVSLKNSINVEDSEILEQRFNTSVTTDSGKVKDCQSELHKLISKTLRNSHKCVIKAVKRLNEEEEGKSSHRDLDNMEECTLTQLLKQNFMTDHKIYILGTIDLLQINNPEIGVNAVVRTIDFISEFRNNVGNFLMKNILAKDKDNSVESIPKGSILGGLMVDIEDQSVTPSHIAISKRDEWLKNKNLKLLTLPDKSHDGDHPTEEGKGKLHGDEVIPFENKTLILDEAEPEPIDFADLATVMTKFFTFLGQTEDEKGGEEVCPVIGLDEKSVSIFNPDEGKEVGGIGKEVVGRLKMGQSVSRIAKTPDHSFNIGVKHHGGSISYLLDMRSQDQLLMNAITKKANQFQHNLVLLDVSQNEVEEGIKNNSKYINPSLNTSKSILTKLLAEGNVRVVDGHGNPREGKKNNLEYIGGNKCNVEGGDIQPSHGIKEKKEIYQLAPHPGKKEENSQKPISERIQDMIRSETPYFKAPVGLNSHRANINSHRTNQIVPLPENMEEDDEEPGNSSTKSDLTVEKINIKDILSFSSKCMNYSFSRLLRRFDSGMGQGACGCVKTGKRGQDDIDMYKLNFKESKSMSAEATKTLESVDMTPYKPLGSYSQIHRVKEDNQHIEGHSLMGKSMIVEAMHYTRTNHKSPFPVARRKENSYDPIKKEKMENEFFKGRGINKIHHRRHNERLPHPLARGHFGNLIELEGPLRPSEGKLGERGCTLPKKDTTVPGEGKAQIPESSRGSIQYPLYEAYVDPKRRSSNTTPKNINIESKDYGENQHEELFDKLYNPIKNPIRIDPKSKEVPLSLTSFIYEDTREDKNNPNNPLTPNSPSGKLIYYSGAPMNSPELQPKVGIESPGIASPGIKSQGIKSPGIESPGIESPGIECRELGGNTSNNPGGIIRNKGKRKIIRLKEKRGKKREGYGSVPLKGKGGLNPVIVNNPNKSPMDHLGTIESLDTKDPITREKYPEGVRATVITSSQPVPREHRALRKVCVENMPLEIMTYRSGGERNTNNPNPRSLHQQERTCPRAPVRAIHKKDYYDYFIPSAPVENSSSITTQKNLLGEGDQVSYSLLNIIQANMEEQSRGSVGGSMNNTSMESRAEVQVLGDACVVDVEQLPNINTKGKRNTSTPQQHSGLELSLSHTPQ